MAALVEDDILANELERTDPKLRTLFERDGATFYSKNIEKRPAEVVSARDMRIPLEIKPGGRFRHFNPDGGDLGRGTGPKFDKALLPSQPVLMAVEWTRKSDWVTDNARKSVLSTFRHLVATSMAEFRKHIDNLVMGAGDGVVATVTSVSTTGGKDTIVCSDSATYGDGWDVHLLRDQGYYSIYDSTLSTRRTFTGGASSAGYAPIDLYDIGTKSARFNGTTGGTVAGDKVVVEGLTATPPISILGVRYHHSDSSTGSWLGLDRASIPVIRANRVNANSSALAMPFARVALNKIGNRLGKDKMVTAKACMHPCQAQAYEEAGQQVSVINKQAKEEGLNLFFNDNMQLAGAPVDTYFSWNKRYIDFIVKEVWGRSEIQPVGYYTDKNGRKFFEARSTDGGVAAADIFYLAAYFNTYVNNPAACSYISDLAIPDGY
jgi:hypothetical protein